MIGFFDSGFGGLTVVREIVKELPEYSFTYLGDNARAPYGPRSQEVIYQFTLEGVKELFRRGAPLVILACNTSSSQALRRIQQEFLPRVYPEGIRPSSAEVRSRRVLGIIIPTAEEVGNFTTTKELGVLATEATVNSYAYSKEIAKVNPAIKVYEQSCPLLVPIIEAGETEWEGLDLIIQKYLAQLFAKSSRIDSIILGCTHYAIIAEKIKKYLPGDITLIDQGPIIARRLKAYLERHPEIEENLAASGEQYFLTTEKSEQIKSLASLFYGQPIKMEKVGL